MRTAQVLKYFSYVVFVVGVAMAVHLFQVKSFYFWGIILGSFLGSILLRIVAIVAQLLYELHQVTMESLLRMERSQYESNALIQEIRDLLDKNA